MSAIGEQHDRIYGWYLDAKRQIGALTSLLADKDKRIAELERELLALRTGPLRQGREGIGYVIEAGALGGWRAVCGEWSSPDAPTKDAAHALGAEHIGYRQAPNGTAPGSPQAAAFGSGRVLGGGVEESGAGVPRPSQDAGGEHGGAR